MSNNMMINPANYYNPFAKYNYVSKTRGVYIPKDTEPLLKAQSSNEQKSASIYSENYDAETDIMQSLNQDNNNIENNGIIGFISRFFKEEQ